jgi:cation diffusion facilitator CzcD-associated flavoprotein CzcO
MENTDVAIVGAGPYGLSVAAHLRAGGVDYRQFGMPMRLWRACMPRGMFLKSQGFASNLSDPAGTHTLGAFCQATGRGYADCGRPVPLADFVRYGEWFQSELGLSVEEQHVAEIADQGEGFVLRVADQQVKARKVVVAIGVESFAHIPEPLSALPAELCTHSSRHADPAAFAGREVVVVGAGSSALELAGLLHENGASVKVLVRGDVLWAGEPHCPPRSVVERARVPESGLGGGWRLWFYSNLPDVFRVLPAQVRVSKARNVLGPSGANWLHDRVEGQVPILTGHGVAWAKPVDGRVRLGVARRAENDIAEIEADHVIAATGYRIDLDRLAFLSDGIRARLETVGKSPAVGRGLESSVAGLHFVGPAASPSFGPVTRFVYGAHHAATTIAPRLTRGSAR